MKPREDIMSSTVAVSRRVDSAPPCNAAPPAPLPVVVGGGKVEDTNRRAADVGTPRMGLFRHSKQAMQNNPSKAPVEMANAIRRRRQTSDLDYWHTLPSGPHHSPRPLYRAVIRGALNSENTVCTLSSIVEAATEKEYTMVVKRNNLLSNGYQINGCGGTVIQNYSGGGGSNSGTVSSSRNLSVIRAEDVGLTISGLSISDARTKQQQQGNLSSPGSRSNEWKNTNSNNSSNINNNNNSAPFSAKPRNITTLSGQTNGKNGAMMNYGNGNGENGYTTTTTTTTSTTENGMGQKAGVGKANSKAMIPLSVVNVKQSQRVPRFSMTTRQTTNGDHNTTTTNTDTKLIRTPISPRSESSAANSRKDPSASLDLPKSFTPFRNALIRQSSLPVSAASSNNDSNSKPPFLDANGNSIISPPAVETNLAKRKFSQEVDNCKKTTSSYSSSSSSNNTNNTNNNGVVTSSSSSSSSSSCLQFANSVLGAMTGDLNQMYSICQAKVRYAEFIEQSQPHRLGDLELEDNSNRFALRDYGLQSKGQSYQTTAKENSFTTNNNSYSFNKSPTRDGVSMSVSPMFPPFCSSPPSSSALPLPPTMATTSASPSPVASNKNGLPLRLAPIATRNNKSLNFREPDLEARHKSYFLDKPRAVSFETDPDSPRIKTTRPILKSSKTDIDTTIPPFRHHGGDKIDNNNNNNNNSISNRLVRFKVNHEVREFAPSEPPVRIS